MDKKGKKNLLESTQSSSNHRINPSLFETSTEKRNHEECLGSVSGLFNGTWGSARGSEGSPRAACLNLGTRASDPQTGSAVFFSILRLKFSYFIHNVHPWQYTGGYVVPDPGLPSTCSATKAVSMAQPGPF